LTFESKNGNPGSEFQTIFHQAPVGIAQISPNGTWLRVNNRCCEMLGYLESELRRKWLTDIIHPDDCGEVLDGWRNLLGGLVSSHCVEKPCFRKNGTVFWGRLNLSLVRDRDNEPQHFIAIFEDITQQKQTERALRESERRLALATNAGRLGMWDADLRTGITVISGRYAGIHGLEADRSTITHDEWMGLIHPDDRERINALLEATVEGGRIWETDFRIVVANGTMRWLHGRGQVYLGNGDRPIRMAGVTIDVTERKQAEAALRKSEQQLALIYNTVRDVIFHLAVEQGGFRFVSVNAAFLRVTGLSQETVVGRMVNHVIPEPSLTLVLEKYRQAIEEKTIVSWEETTDYPTGRLTGEVTIAPVIDDQGNCTHLVGSVHDITERKHAEAALRESEQRLRNSEQQLQALAGALLTAQEGERRRISSELHDNLIQQLAALAMELGVLATEFPLVKNRLQTLQMRTVEAAEASRHMAYRLHPCELDDLGLDTALRAYCEDFRRNGIAVEFTSAKLPESLNREVASCLYKVAQEGLRNISKHAQAERAWVTLEGRGDRVVLQVKDSGIGFRTESLSAAAGLGVASMRERVRILNGAFTIQSRPEQGTLITVEVPLPRAESRTSW
jgi:PAS domain S-box-containing protein